MDLSAVVLIESKPAPKKTLLAKGKMVKISARVSYKTRRPTRTYDSQGNKKESWYSSIFADFVGFKKSDGSEPAWVSWIQPGEVLQVNGEVSTARGKNGENFTNFTFNDVRRFIQGNNTKSQDTQTSSNPSEDSSADDILKDFIGTSEEDDDMPF